MAGFEKLYRLSHLHDLLPLMGRLYFLDLNLLVSPSFCFFTTLRIAFSKGSHVLVVLTLRGHLRLLKHYFVAGVFCLSLHCQFLSWEYRQIVTNFSKNWSFPQYVYLKCLFVSLAWACHRWQDFKLWLMLVSRYLQYCHHHLPSSWNHVLIISQKMLVSANQRFDPMECLLLHLNADSAL